MLLDLLRERTATLHARVETALDLPSWAADVRSYGRLLTRLLGFYAPMEGRLSSFDWTSVKIDFEQRRKVPLLAADLRALGCDSGEISAAPECERLPPLPSLAAAFGALYVLEGATLGGQLISKHISDSLRIGPINGGSFHGAYGQNTSARWREFRAAANAHCDEDVDRTDAALAAAVATFEAFDLWLRQSGSLETQIPTQR